MACYHAAYLLPRSLFLEGFSSQFSVGPAVRDAVLYSDCGIFHDDDDNDSNGDETLAMTAADDYEHP